MDAMEASLGILKIVMQGEDFEKLNCDQKCKLATENFKKIFNEVRNCSTDGGCETDTIRDSRRNELFNSSTDDNTDKDNMPRNRR